MLVAWASASWKTFVAKEIAQKLTDLWKKVLVISADNYYTNDSAIKAMVYGTYDHPILIEHSLLREHINQLILGNKIEMPNYSFVEKARIAPTIIEWYYDHIIVEWIYVIAEVQLPQALKVFVNSPAEDLIIRRLVRDPERIQEPLRVVTEALVSVYPMWMVMWNWQKTESDIVIDNDYEILDQKWHMYTYEKIDRMMIPQTYVEKRTVIDYLYNDETTDNGWIVISEVYRDWDSLLQKVKISKIKHHEWKQQWLSLELNNPGALIQLHTLIQLAQCNYLWKTQKIIYKISEQESVHLIWEECFHVMKQQ